MNMLKPIKLAKVPVFERATVANVFASGTQKIQPIIFCHGLMQSRSQYTGYCRELASYGFAVFALNFHDGSCEYTEGAFEFAGGKRARK